MNILKLQNTYTENILSNSISLLLFLFFFFFFLKINSKISRVDINIWWKTSFLNVNIFLYFTFFLFLMKQKFSLYKSIKKFFVIFKNKKFVFFLKFEILSRIFNPKNKIYDKSKFSWRILNIYFFLLFFLIFWIFKL